MKNLRKTLENSDILQPEDYEICYVLSLYAVDYYDLFECIECHDPEIEDAMDDVLDYLYFLCYEKDYDIGWVRLPIA